MSGWVVAGLDIFHIWNLRSVEDGGDEEKDAWIVFQRGMIRTIGSPRAPPWRAETFFITRI